MTSSVYQCACPSAISMLLKDCEQKIYPLPICPLDIGKYIMIKSGPKLMALSDHWFWCVCVSFIYLFILQCKGLGEEPMSSNMQASSHH